MMHALPPPPHHEEEQHGGGGGITSVPTQRHNARALDDSDVVRHYLIGTQKWAAKAVETPLFFPPKVPQSMFVGADLTATKLGPKNFRKTCCVTATATFVDDFWGPLRLGKNLLWKKGIQN